MRSLAIVIIAAFALSGCASTSNNLPSQQQVSDVITKVQDTTAKICAFVPTAQTVAAVVDALGAGGIASGVTGIASQICAAVTKKSIRRGARPTVKGVPIHGRFVR